MGGERPRDKGLRVENRLVHLHRELGVRSERVPLSGSAKFRNTAGTDIDVYVHGPDAAPWLTEAKSRKDGEGFVVLERWLGSADALFLVRDRAAPLVLLPWERWADLLQALK